MVERGRSLNGDTQDRESTNDSNSTPRFDTGAPVLSQIHVSCYVTAANRATPVFEVLPQQNCVRVVNKSAGDVSSGSAAGMTGAVSTGVNSHGGCLSAEWVFHSVFSSSSPSHAVDFFTEITLPALRTAREGINSNVVVWGVHPTQKFRLVFGKSVGGGGFAPQPEMAVNDVVELYGQLVGMLHAFYSQLDLGYGNARLMQHPECDSWRLGISSWIIVNNQAIDLLKTPVGVSANTRSTSAPSVEVDQQLSFITLEAPSLSTAFRIVQMAKTNRIVRKQNEESVHFFVRLALFHDGQVSTVHLVDLIDQKNSQDHVSIQEKLELYNILQNLKQPMLSPRQQNAPASPSAGKMVLSNFMKPLLTANAKTFFYANAIDSRTSLRESVQMLNAVANLRGFACVCKRLSGVSFEQLGFQSNSSEFERLEVVSQSEQSEHAAVEADRDALNSLSRPVYQAAVNSLPVGTHSRSDSSSMLENRPSDAQAPELNDAQYFPRIGSDTEAMSWLSAFTQRKRDILGGSIDTIPTISVSSRSVESSAVETTSFSVGGSRAEIDEPQQLGTALEARSSISDLYERLRESLDEVNEIEPTILAIPRASHCSVHSLSTERSTHNSHCPLPIADQEAAEHMQSTGYSRATIGGIARHVPQQPYEGDQCVSMDEPNFASVRRHADVSAAFPREIIDSMNHRSARNSLESFSLATPISSSLPTSSENQLKSDQITLEAFKKAGISPCLLESPNLDGLDVKTAQKVQAADATLLRKNYAALLSIVREQQQAKEAAEARATEALHDQEEQRAMFEVQIENMKLANVGLRSKVRALENRTPMPQVFEQYEQELRTLHAQVQELQTRNVALELRVCIVYEYLKLWLRISTMPNQCGDLQASSSEGSVVIASSVPSSSDIKKKYQQVVEEKLALEREVMEHRRRERHHQVHSRLAGQSTKRVDQLSRDLNNKEEDLVATRLSKQRISAEMNQALEKADQLHHENEKLLQEKAATTEELLATRMYLASLENEKKKASILDRFVEKHGDRMNKLRQNGQRSSSKCEGWRRDQYARECEDKLLSAVKRSLPQAVPLCNKLLRRLEMQELSLREFSEREVDFINLLVELVSDQTTVSLKQMIEQEMKKLQTC